MKKIYRIFKYSLLAVSAVLIASLAYFSVGWANPAPRITWGINFSDKYADGFGLDSKKMFLSLLDDLGTKNIKLITHWDRLEPQRNKFDWERLDWEVKESENRNVKLLFVLGMKTPRWPECHIPDWVKSIDAGSQNQEVEKLLTETVNRYKKSPAVWAWQVENEPLFSFGECPPADKDFLKKEVALVKQLDPSRPVVISDTGEWSLWFEVGRIGNIVSTTLYRKVWFAPLNIGISYPYPAVTYKRRADLLNWFLGKNVINGELQAEPWGNKLAYDLPVDEQKSLFSTEQFKKNIDYAKATGLNEFYFWGAEWWYYMKEKNNDSSYWDTAKTLMK